MKWSVHKNPKFYGNFVQTNAPTTFSTEQKHSKNLLACMRINLSSAKRVCQTSDNENIKCETINVALFIQHFIWSVTLRAGFTAPIKAAPSNFPYLSRLPIPNWLALSLSFVLHNDQPCKLVFLLMGVAPPMKRGAAWRITSWTTPLIHPTTDALESSEQIDTLRLTPTASACRWIAAIYIPIHHRLPTFNWSKEAASSQQLGNEKTTCI